MRIIEVFRLFLKQWPLLLCLFYNINCYVQVMYSCISA